jgi:hypothetical protein
MPLTLVFDERDSVERVIEKYGAICGRLGVDDTTRPVGEDLIRSFHRDLVRSAGMGNGARLEKIISGTKGSLRITGVTRSERSGFSELMSWLWG